MTVVGIGEDGWAGLGESAREAITAAHVVYAAPRHAALVPVACEALPSPLLPGLWDLLAAKPYAVVLASGDPMLHGIATTIGRRLPVRTIPAVSSVSLAAAHLGWPLAATEVVSLVTAPPSTVLAHVAPGARLLVLVRDSSTCAQVRAALDGAGWSASTITVLEHLGGPRERISPVQESDLAVLAVTCAPDPSTRVLPRTGLPDEAYESDGLLTRREVRALVLSCLAPQPGQLLWDVGAGTGSIGIEWCRAAARTRCLSVEPRADRALRVGANAHALGVVDRVQVVEGSAPEALAGLDAPDAVFLGGGLAAAFDPAWAALRPGGRLVATAVTLESENLLQQWHSLHGGTLTRLEISHVEPLGGFTGWVPARPVVIWEVTR